VIAQLLAIAVVSWGFGIALGRWVERRPRLKSGPNRRIHLADTAPGRKETA